MKTKKFMMVISTLLVLSMMFSLTASALEPQNGDSGTSIRSSLIDAEGKENVFFISIISKGDVSVDHYIDGIYIGTATAKTTDGYLVNGIFRDAKTRAENEYTLDFSTNTKKGTRFMDTAIGGSLQRLSIRPLAYSLAGTITYKPYYDGYGNVYNEKLNVYLQAGSEFTEYRTLNTTAGYAASIAIGAIVAILTLFCPPLAAIASEVLGALALVAGTTIVGGIIQGAISKTYYTKVLPYDIKATDPKTSRNNYYTGERCYTAVPGSGSVPTWSSSYYYNGYLPWNSNAVAYWIFCDFWAFPYPGI